MTKPRRTKPTKAELAESYRVMELQELRFLGMLACYEALHGSLPDGLFETVVREATEAQRLNPTNKQGMYTRMVNLARDNKAAMELKQIQNSGETAPGALNAMVSIPSAADIRDTLALASQAKRRP